MPFFRSFDENAIENFANTKLEVLVRIGLFRILITKCCVRMVQSAAFSQTKCLPKPGRKTSMKKFVSGIIATVSLLTAGIGLSADNNALPQLSAEHAQCRVQVLPNSSEQSYCSIAWRTSVLHGLVDAQKNDKPVMIFLMNGHPLGCT
jgi:hypothetical protein